MLGWLYSLIIGNFCNHKYEVIRKIDGSYQDGSTAIIIASRCKNCGDIKQKHIS